MTSRKLKNWSPFVFIPTMCGAGFFPKASGTFASLISLIPAWFIKEYLGSFALLVLAFFFLLIGTYTVSKYLKYSESKDPKEVVIDELVGQWIALCIMPVTLAGFAIGFIAFRFFDVLKPWPVSFFDKRVKNAFGVMMDDVAAGLYLPAIIFLIATICTFFKIDFNIFAYVGIF